MDVDALRTFLAIHETGGFSAAGEVLGRTQPAISRRIAILEDELGARLFERTSAGILLSDAGRALVPHAVKVLAAIREGEGAMADLRRAPAGPVALAAVGTLAGANLTPILKRFTAEHPGVDLSLRTATSAEVSNLVRRGEATLGLRYLHDGSPDLICRHIDSERMIVACAPEHPLAGARLVTIAELAGETWFAFPNAFDQRDTFAGNVFSQFQAAGVGCVRAAPVDSLTAQKRLVEAGLGLALLSENAAADELSTGSLSTIEVASLTAVNPVHLVVRREGYLSPAARRLMEILAAEPVASGDVSPRPADTAQAAPGSSRGPGRLQARLPRR